MKVLLNDNLFYYTIVMHTDMQELMWAGECMHSVLSAIILPPLLKPNKGLS